MVGDSGTMEMLDDPYTMEMRLCDDDGMVSDAPIVEDILMATSDRSYLERLNRLINMGRGARGDKPRFIEKPFACTGDAHLIAEHIRCTSPAHQRPAPILDLLGHRSTVVHQWRCPRCSYTVTRDISFVLDQCPGCFDGRGRAWSASKTYNGGTL